MKHRSAIQPVLIIAILVITGLMACSTSGPRERSSFNSGWRFSLAASDDAWKGDFDDTGWRLLDLPHDWCIEGEFSESNPAGAGGGALPGGTGWYRKTFKIDPSKKDKLVYIEFDGVYRNSEVWINGHYLGKRPYGYSSFRYELTPYLSYGDEMNILAVKVDNSKQPNSRWYSGSGIYRNVWLVSTEKIAVDHWGTFVTASVISKDSARIRISAAIRNSTGSQAPVTVASTVFNPGGQKVAMVKNAGINLADTVTVVTQEVTLADPALWSVEKPDLYRVMTEVMSGGKVFDRYETVTGIRSFAFDSEKGFVLNGKHVRILGVCDHHDLGCLGAAINTRAIERQLELLKEMGCNGIRTSHNPPAPELLDLCDRTGLHSHG